MLNFLPTAGRIRFGLMAVIDCRSGVNFLWPNVACHTTLAEQRNRYSNLTDKGTHQVLHLMYD